jgi:hypothetical protein
LGYNDAAMGEPRSASGPAGADIDAAVATDWFREPTVREHRIAAGLFVGFAVFFAMLFVVQAGWWFRWVVLGLAAWSLLYGLSHARDAWRGRRVARAGAAAGTAGEREGAAR